MPSTPRTPSSNRLAPTIKGGKSRAPQTPNTRAQAQAAVAATAPSHGGQQVETSASKSVTGGPTEHPSRAWRTGGDRKIMFEGRSGPALVAAVRRPEGLVKTLKVCASLLIANGAFQVAMSKLSRFVWPLHWVGVLLLLLGIATTFVRTNAGRCGTSPQSAAKIAVVAVGVCFTAWLAYEGPFYADIEIADECLEPTSSTVCPTDSCFCSAEDDEHWWLCVDFDGSCEDIPLNRRYLALSLYSLWVAIGLAFAVGLLSVMIITDFGSSTSPVPFGSKKNTGSVRRISV